MYSKPVINNRFFYALIRGILYTGYYFGPGIISSIKQTLRRTRVLSFYRQLCTYVWN